MAGIAEQLNEETAPPYAKEKYRQRDEFYVQGGINIKRRAAKINGYDEKQFDELVNVAANREHDVVLAKGAAYLPTLNQKI